MALNRSNQNPCYYLDAGPPECRIKIPESGFASSLPPQLFPAGYQTESASCEFPLVLQDFGAHSVPEISSSSSSRACQSGTNYLLSEPGSAV